MSASRIALITSDHARHRWVARRLAEAAELVAVVAESKPAAGPAGSPPADPVIREHFAQREAAESRWLGGAPHFEALAGTTLRRGWQGANGADVADALRALDPDLVFLFGSCIIRDPLLGHFAGRIVNMHLGLSPYYRGSGTNFWPLVDGLPECVGVTVHHASPVVDGGAVIAQVRPEAVADDDAHSLGCKTVRAGAAVLARLAAAGRAPPGAAQTGGGKLCRRKDFDSAAVLGVRRNLAEGMMPRYLARKSERDARFPIQSADAI